MQVWVRRPRVAIAEVECRHRPPKAGIEVRVLVATPTRPGSELAIIAVCLTAVRGSIPRRGASASLV